MTLAELIERVPKEKLHYRIWRDGEDGNEFGYVESCQVDDEAETISLQ